MSNGRTDVSSFSKGRKSWCGRHARRKAQPSTKLGGSLRFPAPPILKLITLLILAVSTVSARAEPSSWVVQMAQAKQDADSDAAVERMNRRFPQKVRAGALVGLPVLDYGDVTLGIVRHVVRGPDKRIKLIVIYSKWFGWFGRPVAVPIEAVAILARQIASLDMSPNEFEAAPTWSQGSDAAVPGDEIIRIAVTRR
jgi:hypothetical protein